MEQKLCTKCDTRKDTSAFGKNRSQKDGLQSHCKDCRSLYQKKWYQQNKDLHLERVRRTRPRKTDRTTRSPEEVVLDAHVRKIGRSLESRFLSKVNITEECWLWTGATRSGYGALKADGRVRGAHVVSWYLGTGTWPEDGILVCHHCDNRACVKFSHLFLGTYTDNTQDAIEKDRLYRTDPNAPWTHPLSQWTEETYAELVALRLEGLSERSLADHFNVSRGSVRKALGYRDI